MHMMRIKEAEAKRSLARSRKKTALTPLAKEIELRREEMIRGILQNTPAIVNKQLEVASLPVTPDGPDNTDILKASNSLLDRVFGKPKESIDLTGAVQFSLRALSKQADEIEALEIESKVVE